MKGSSLVEYALVTSANLIAEEAPRVFVAPANLLADSSKATVHLVSDGRRLTAHVVAKLRNLQREDIYPGG